MFAWEVRDDDAGQAAGPEPIFTVAHRLDIRRTRLPFRFSFARRAPPLLVDGNRDNDKNWGLVPTKLNPTRSAPCDKRHTMADPD
jgi:hypothetical protein